MNDRIIVSNLVLHGHHGVLPEETRLGQKFYIDIECWLDLTACSLRDSYEDTVCYERLCAIAAAVSDAGPFKLIETLGENIARRILEHFTLVQDVRVRVRKPTAPIKAPVDHVAIEIHRRREAVFALSLGTNVGDRSANMRTAMTLLAVDDFIEIDRTSSYYRTKPWGNENQDWFMNACMTGRTTLTAKQVLRLCKGIEMQMGRMPGERWGPRLIDIDVLALGDQQISRPEMTLPHPELFNRAFVLKPLAEIAPEMDIAGQRVLEAWEKLEAMTEEGDIAVIPE